MPQAGSAVDAGADISFERAPERAIDVSEEAALYAKRLRTLCGLLWARRIEAATYAEEASRAYREYHETRAVLRSE